MAKLLEAASGKRIEVANFAEFDLAMLAVDTIVEGLNVSTQLAQQLPILVVAAVVAHAFFLGIYFSRFRLLVVV